MSNIIMMLMACDYITGLSKAVYTAKLNSYVGFKGVSKKTAMLGFMLAGATVDSLQMLPVEVSPLIITLVISTEMISIMENLSAMNILIPDKIKKLFENNVDME